MTNTDVQYSSYLQLEKVLSAQTPLSDHDGKPAHDEMLFIVTHQAFELWFKQILFELDTVVELLNQEYVPERAVADCTHFVRRVNRILEMATEHFAVLETMTPLDFMDFRNFLGSASGFQSFQFRVLETKLGVPPQRRLNPRYREYLPADQQVELEALMTKKNLRQVVEQWLEKMPFSQADGYQFWEEYQSAVKKAFDRDRLGIRTSILSEEEQSKQLEQIDKTSADFLAIFDEKLFAEQIESGLRLFSRSSILSALFIYVYRDQPLIHQAFRLVEQFVELDRLISVWRFRHAMMVSRMIGSRTGTGGSSGFDFLLASATQHRVFRDLADLAGYLIQRKEIPDLPTEIKSKLQFVSEA